MSNATYWYHMMLRMASAVRIVPLGLAILTAVGTQSTLAQDASSKPLRIIVPWGPGGPPDVIPRLLAPYLSAELGHPVIIENRAAGLGMPAINETLKQPADGYTVFAADSSHWATVPALQTAPYDFLQSFAPVSLVFSTPHLWVVNSSSSVKTMQDLIALAKANPMQVNYATVGIGSAAHLQVESLAHSLGIKFSPIFYKSGGEAAMALLRGDVQFWVNGVAGPLPHVKAGKMTVLGIGRKAPLSMLPNVVPISELTGLKDFDWAAQQGWVVRADTPKPIVDRLAGAIGRAMDNAAKQPDFAAKVLGMGGAELNRSTPEQFLKYVHDDFKKYKDLIKTIGLKAQ